MGKAVRDIATLALGGFVIGTMLGVLAAGAYATWAVGGDPANIGFGTVFAFAPWEIGYFGEPFRTALMIGGAAALVVTIATPALGFKRTRTSHGTADWASPAELKKREVTAPLGQRLIGPIFGKLGKPRSRAPFLTSQTDPNDPRAIPHSLVTGSTGSGKGVGIIIPTLLTYKGSVICLDPKGENFEKTARARRAMGDTVFRFSPWDADRRSHRFNPLDYVVEAAEDRRYAEAKSVASNLIVAHGDGQGFLGGARDIFAAVTLVVIQRDTPTIGAVFDALTTGGETFDVLDRLAEEVDAPEAKKTLRQYAGYENRILSSYMSILFNGGLGLWADPNVRAATAESDFRVETMRQRGVSIFVTVSANHLETLAPLIRLLFQQSIAVLQSREPIRRKKPGFLASLFGRKTPEPGGLNEIYPVLFLMDEFVSLGKLDVLATAITTLRGFGGRVMIVVQSLAALRHLYGKEGASNFLANCRLQVFMSPSDEDTPDYISKAIGQFTRPARTKSWRTNEFQTQVQERDEGAPLIRPEQVRQLGDERVLALIQNCNPALVHRVTYYKDRALKRIYEGQTGALPQAPELASQGPSSSPDPTPPTPVPQPDPETAAQPVESEAAARAEVTPSAVDERIATEGVATTDGPVPAERTVRDQTPDAPTAKAFDTQEAAEDLTPEAERTVHKGLGHISIEQSHLHDEILGRLADAQGKTSKPRKADAKETRNQVEAPSNGGHEHTVDSVAPSSPEGSMTEAVQLSDVERARAEARKRAAASTKDA